MLLAGGCSAGDEPEREADASYRAPAGLLLARPAAEGEEEQNPTVEVLLDLIWNTPAGERIRIVGNSFSFVPVAEALVAAHERGVRVQVLVDERASGEWEAPELLLSALGDDRRADSFIQLRRGGVHPEGVVVQPHRPVARRGARGLDVEVVLGKSVGEQVRQVLADSGVEVSTGVFADGEDVHHKLTVVSHPAPGGGVRRFVLTGSDNYTTKSLDRPEVVLRLDGDRGPAFGRYQRWVDALVARGEREDG